MNDGGHIRALCTTKYHHSSLNHSSDDDHRRQGAVLISRLFGFWVRREACRLASNAIRGSWAEERNAANTLWALTVFFEEYMRKGADETQADWGPKDPVDLSLVRAKVAETTNAD